ncbi:hypothetical protein TNCV_3765621 [Trichonephila clavipes]|nr:hypothetical protein TNCV_3765621 [Trichonephila clavipes]
MPPTNIDLRMPDLGMCSQNQHKQTSSPAKQSSQNYSKLPALYCEKIPPHNDANIQPLNERIRTLAENFHSQISSHPNASISSQANAITTGSLNHPIHSTTLQNIF